MKRFLLLVFFSILGFFSGSGLYVFLNYDYNHVCTPESNDSFSQDFINNQNESMPHNISPYTGEKLELFQEKNIPFFCLMETSQKSQEFSGLSQADIIYEISFNDNSKLLALFHKNSPDIIGPINSNTSAFFDIHNFKNNNNILNDLNKKNIKHTENTELTTSNSQYYWIDKNKVAPLNMYTSAEKIRNLISHKNYITLPNNSLNFDKTYWFDESLGIANGINLNCKNSINISYKFKDNYYERYTNGNIVCDISNDEPLKFSNIIIQIYNKETSKPPISQSLSNGLGYVFSNGKVQNIMWNKTSNTSNVNFFTSEGENLNLTPGTTFWHIIDTSSTISFD